MSNDTEVNEEIPENFFPPKYDPENDPHFDIDETTMFLGLRRAGKTTMCTEWNLKRRRYWPYVYVFTKTRENNYWQQFVPARKIAGKLDDDVLRQIIIDNTERYSEWKLIKHKTGKYKGNPIVKLIFEDLITEDILKKSKPLQTICYNGRHAGISADIMAQDYCGMKRGERDNMDRWVVFKPDSAATLKMFRESLGDRILDVARRVWDKGYAFIYNKKTRVPLMERMSWYECDMCYVESSIHKNLHLGNTEWWAGVDVKKQKDKFPCVELPSLATLEGKFNEKIAKDDDTLKSTNVDEATIPTETTDTKTPQVTVPVTSLLKPF